MLPLQPVLDAELVVELLGLEPTLELELEAEAEAGGWKWGQRSTCVS